MSYDTDTAVLSIGFKHRHFTKRNRRGADFISIAIVKSRVDQLMHLETGCGRYSRETLQKNLDIVLAKLEFDVNLFQYLLCSMPARFRQVREANGGETDY